MASYNRTKNKNQEGNFMKKAARIVASLILAGAMSAVAMADNDFEFKGYARAGVLYNAGLKQVGGIDTKYIGRLGNENESPYMEAELVKNFKAGKTWGKYHVMFATESRGKTTWDPAEGSVMTRQAFVEMGGFAFAPKATVWAGKRYYGRDDVHVTDFYWRDLSGTGAGVQGLMDGNLDIAMINGRNEGSTADGNITNINLDARYRMGNFEFEGLVGLYGGAEDAGQGEDTIVQGAVVYGMSNFFGMGAGFSKVALQAGTNTGAWNLGTTPWTPGGNSDMSAIRLSAFGVTDMGKWQIMPAFRYEYTSPKDGDGMTEISAVVRPQYVVNDNFVMAFEAGLGTHSYWGADTEMSYKLTAAPTLKLDSNGFWNRPELRAFVTYVGGNDDFGKISADGKDESELRIGTQAEVWF